MTDLRWKKFPVLDQGFVCLVDVMGDDSSVVQAARVSYGAGTKHTSDDRTLIRYLYRHAHLTPFEMAEIKLLVRVPMDCWRQWIRHRTANVNEYSTRYSEAIDAAQQVPPDGWRRQAADNKQGSAGRVAGFPESWGTGPMEDYTGPEVKQTTWWFDHEGEPACRATATAGEYLCERQEHLLRLARDVYEERLDFGVAREQARKDLPLSTYTEAYWKCDLRNVLGFLSLRMDAHAQAEIRQYAAVIGEEIVAPLFPLCWEAFNDYDARRGGLLLSRLDVEIAARIMGGPGGKVVEDGFRSIAAETCGWPTDGRCRERDECQEKLVRLGLVSEK